jgi:hypothetical protein
MEIFTAQVAAPVSLTPAANGKNLQSEKFLLFFWTNLGDRVNMWIKLFPSRSLLGVSSLIRSLYLPPVSTTPAVPVAKFAACVVDTDGAP